MAISKGNSGDLLSSFRYAKIAQKEIKKYNIDYSYAVYNDVTLIETYKRLGMIEQSLLEAEKKTLESIKTKDNLYVKGVMHAVYASLLLEQQKSYHP